MEGKKKGEGEYRLVKEERSKEGTKRGREERRRERREERERKRKEVARVGGRGLKEGGK